MIKTLALIVLLGLPVIALSDTNPAYSFPEGEDWGIAELEAHIQKQEKTGKPFRSVDELLKSLPAGLKKYFTFIYATRNRFQDASPLHPRALAFAQNLFYTFNGHPAQRGYDTVELMAFDKPARKFELREISLVSDGKMKKVALSEANPAKCLGCHGSDPRPIWSSYDQWAGVYGSDDDRLPEAELADYKKFLAELDRDPTSRYHVLDFPKDTPIPPYGPRGGGDDKFRINLLLTQMLTRMNALRVARLFSEAERYDAFRWVLPDLVTSYQSGKTISSYGCYLPYVDGGNLASLMQKMTHEEFPQRTRKETLPALAFTAFGLSVDQVSMEMGATEFQYADGTELFLSVLRTALLLPLIEENPDLKSRFVHRTNVRKADYGAFPIYQYIDSLVGRLENPGVGEASACSVIEEKSQNQIDQIVTDGLPALTQGARKGEGFSFLLSEAERLRADAAIPPSCTYCHVVSGEGPPISFDSAERLAKELRADEGRLYRTTLVRSQPTAASATHMPPPSSEEFAPLSQAEFDRFEEFLKGLVSP